MIGTWLRMATMGGLGAASAGALAAGVAAPAALSVAAAVDAPSADAPSADTPDAPASDGDHGRSCGKEHDHDNLGARVRGWHEEGLRGRELAAEIHAHHAERGRGHHGR